MTNPKIKKIICVDSDPEDLNLESSESSESSESDSEENKEVAIKVCNTTKSINTTPNFKCGNCESLVFIDKKQDSIKCDECGYRILYKTRTINYITYKTG